MNKRLELVLTTDMGNTRNVSVELGPSKPVFVVGSSGDADLRLRNPAVAAYHCRLRAVVDGFVVENIDPTAVTFFNNKPLVTAALLREGDAIRLGTVSLAVRLGVIQTGPADAVAPTGPKPAEPAVPGSGSGRPPGSRARDASRAAALSRRHAPTGGSREGAATPATRPAAAPDAPAVPPSNGPTAAPAVPASTAAPAGTGAHAPAVAPAAAVPHAPAVAPSATVPHVPTVVPVAVESSDTALTKGLPVSGSRGIAPGRPASGGRFSAADPVVERFIEGLTREQPDRVAKRNRQQLQALVESGRERAKRYNLEQEDHVLQFLQCMLLLDSDLDQPTTTDIAYVLDTLTVPNKPADRRIARALTIAKRIAEQTPAPSVAEPPPPASDAAPRVDSFAPDRSGSAAGLSPSARSSSPPRSSPPRSSPPAFSGGPAGDSKAAPAPPTAATLDESLAAIGRSAVSEPPPQSDPEDDFPQIEGFQVIEKIASGGMGTVYRGRDLKLDIEVAIKILRSVHPAAQEQFLLEARAAARLQHPHIVPVLRYEQYGKGGYCVMQLIKGKDASRLIRVFKQQVVHNLDANQIFKIAGLDPASLSPEVRNAARAPTPYHRLVSCWMTGVADALDRAHQQRIIHYDVKPSNMMFAADGRMMLGDFGLASLGDKPFSSNSSCVGTPGYLSPELLAGWASHSGTAETDARVDIWGLGAVMYEFLTYRPAYEGSLSRVLKAIATTDPAAPRDIVWETPAELERICGKAMQRNPEDRYTRASEMADDLRNWLEGKPPAHSTGKPLLSWLRRPAK